MGRFQKLAERGDASAKRVPLYQVIKWHAGMVVDPDHRYHRIANPMVWLSDRVPRRLLPQVPIWSKGLTHEPYSDGVATVSTKKRTAA